MHGYSDAIFPMTQHQHERARAFLVIIGKASPRYRAQHPAAVTWCRYVRMTYALLRVLNSTIAFYSIASDQAAAKPCMGVSYACCSLRKYQATCANSNGGFGIARKLGRPARLTQGVTIGS